MKKILNDLALFLLLFVVFFLPIILYTKLIVDFEELENEFATERVIKDKKIEELEKEIRILKQDIQILQYGFMEE
jgi:cell division protein FtsB